MGLAALQAEKVSVASRKEDVKRGNSKSDGRHDVVQGEAARGLFFRLRERGHIVLGITSYQEYPGRITNPFDDRHTTDADDSILALLDGWLHCFRCA